VDAILLKSLPVRNPDELRIVLSTGELPFGNHSGYHTDTLSGIRVSSSFPYPMYQEFAGGVSQFSDLMGFASNKVTIIAGAESHYADVQFVTGNFFSGLGVTQLAGRTLTPEDDRASASPIAVISYRYWERHLGLQPEAVGRTIFINGRPVTIVGIGPRAFLGIEPGNAPDLFLPMALIGVFGNKWYDLRASDKAWVQIMGRLRPGASEKQATAGLGAVMQRASLTTKKKVEQKGDPWRPVLEDGAGGIQLLRNQSLGPILVLSGVVGLVLLPFAGCALLVAFLFGKAGVYAHAGRQLGRQLGLGAMEKPVLALVLGTLTFYLLYAIPILGFVAWGAITCLAIGAAGLAFFNSFRSEAGAPPVRAGGVPPAAPVGGPLGPPPMPVAADPATLARVGFWSRFFATVLDLLVVGFAMRVLKTHALFVPAWLGYHIGMWAWKGATVGGLALGIRIVRHDGSPIDFAVALVRSLASFLSGAALFLGFFWAGWDREKQSWHDKIAGTIVVKYPKGVPLLAPPHAPGPQSQSATP